MQPEGSALRLAALDRVTTKFDSKRIMWAGRFVFGVFAVVLCASVGYAADVPGGPDPAQVAEGKKAFAAGVAFLQDPDGARYEEAMLQFRRAYELIGTWKVLGNIGICAMKLERDGEAVEAFEKYLQQGAGQLDAEEKAQVERDVSTLKASLVTTHLVFPTPEGQLLDERINNRGVKTVNEYKISATAVDVGLHPGHHTLVAKLPSGESRWETEMAPGSKVEHAFTPTGSSAAPASALPAAAQPATPAAEAKPAEAEARPVPISVWISGGATVALAIGAAVTGAAALSKRSAFNDVNGQPGKGDEARSLHDSAVSMALVNTILTGAAVAGAGVTTYLYLSRPKTSPTRAGRPAIVPWVTADGGGLVLRGGL